MHRVLTQVEQVAGTDSTVLLLGETGTEKELLATQIHEPSGRRARPMVRVNCSAIPATLIGSELFGHEKEHIQSVLASVGWRIRGPAGAADRLGLPPTTLETRMAKLGLNRPQS